MVAVLTQGTLTDPEMLRSHADASYVLSIAEQPAKELSGQPSIGVCAVDCATGQILVGNWYDPFSYKICRRILSDYLSSMSPRSKHLPKIGTPSGLNRLMLDYS